MIFFSTILLIFNNSIFSKLFLDYFDKLFKNFKKNLNQILDLMLKKIEFISLNF